MENGDQALAYKHCTIFYSSHLDTNLLKFVPMAAISWEMRGTVTTYFLRSLKPENTQQKAETQAVEQAKGWIDRINPSVF
jgi:hypothetical protein